MTNTVERPLNLQEASRYLGFRPAYIYNLIHYGKLPAYKPSGKHLRFKLSDLEAFVYRNRRSADYELAEKADTVLNKEAGA
ncbi:MAG: helix-turn-helix domain-containing protein [Treponema sp.]|jgi:excisionase family DNA binding protein|nr:helix-turn-helix domain-containing protein [Treponema sp.]